MSVLVVGVSHRSAPVAVLERLALDGDGVSKLAVDASAADHVTEATVISTCNRIEVYADVERFHGSVEGLSRLLVQRAGSATDEVIPHLYVHYDDGAVSHLFQVAAGLDSLVVGEGQILGQTREALRLGQELGTVGPALNLLFQQALRVGKRARTETDIDRTAPSLVSAALDRVVARTGRVGRRVVLLGAGAMASLAAATVTRAGADELVVVNRSRETAGRLASAYDARTATLEELAAELPTADLLVTCTGSAAPLVTRDLLEQARRESAGPLGIVDLALPHDVEPEAAALPDVVLVNLAQLAEEVPEATQGPEVAGVRDIVAQEVAAFLSARQQASVAPTVVALRSMATSVVDAEVERLLARLPGLDPVSRAEVVQAVRRVADKLLHQPTVRVKELAREPGTVSYATALAELFALDPEAVAAVTSPVVPDEPGPVAP